MKKKYIIIIICTLFILITGITFFKNTPKVFAQSACSTYDTRVGRDLIDANAQIAQMNDQSVLATEKNLRFSQAAELKLLNAQTNLRQYAILGCDKTEFEVQKIKLLESVESHNNKIRYLSLNTSYEINKNDYAGYLDYNQLAPSTTEDCNSLASKLGVDLSLAQANIKILKDDYNQGNTGRKYWQDNKSVTWSEDPMYFVTNTNLTEFLTPDGEVLQKIIWEDVKNAKATNEKIKTLKCPDTTPVKVNSLANPNEYHTETLKDVQTRVNKLPTVMASIANQQSTQTQGVTEPCVKDCQGKYMSGFFKYIPWAGDLICGMACLINKILVQVACWVQNLVKIVPT